VTSGLVMSANGMTTPPPFWIRVLVGRHPRRTLIRILILVVGSFITFNYVLLCIRIQGISMLPTYQNGRLNFVNRLAYWQHEPQRGDVVSIWFTGKNVMLLKRIVGLPGERVAFRMGVIYINDQALEEPYVKKTRAPWNRKEVSLAPDEYFAVGDNREMPDITMHELGEFKRSRIAGKVLF
jgi:signal peptidase I